MEHAAGWAVDSCDGCAGGESFAVGDVEVGRDGGVGEREGRGYDVLAAEDALFARYELSGYGGSCGDEALRGEVAPGSVFQESHTNDGVDGVATGFHQHGTATCKGLLSRIFSF